MQNDQIKKNQDILQRNKSVENYISEFNFCLKLWQEQGHCEFGGMTKCDDCAVPYLLWKFISGEILHGKMERLSIEDWKQKLDRLRLRL
jgi:hypothetical protein